MAIYILDRSLKIDIYYEAEDSRYEDNICLSIAEECPEDEKLFISDETNIYITPAEACMLAKALLAAARLKAADCDEAG